MKIKDRIYFQNVERILLLLLLRVALKIGNLYLFSHCVYVPTVVDGAADRERSKQVKNYRISFGVYSN